jgi:hypothetical protein
MPLLISPSVFSDGTVDHTYTYQNQIQVGKSIVSTYKELAAAAAVLSTLKSKYDVSHPTLVRSVAQINIALPITDGSLKLATGNISFVAHKQHAITDLKLLGLKLKNMTLETEFWDNFFNQI